MPTPCPDFEPSDDALMGRLQARNDTQAFDILFLRHQRAVFSFAYRLLNGSLPSASAIAEDVTQETFLRLWRTRETCRPQHGATLRTYLLTITRHLVLDITRRPRERGMILRETETIKSLSGPESVVLAREFAQFVEEGLLGLPLALRETMILRDIENLPYEQIAVIIGCPIGTVRSRLSAGRKRLRSVVLTYLQENENGG